MALTSASPDGDDRIAIPPTGPQPLRQRASPLHGPSAVHLPDDPPREPPQRVTPGFVRGEVPAPVHVAAGGVGGGGEVAPEDVDGDGRRAARRAAAAGRREGRVRPEAGDEEDVARAQADDLRGAAVRGGRVVRGSVRGPSGDGLEGEVGDAVEPGAKPSAAASSGWKSTTVLAPRAWKRKLDMTS